MTKHKTEEQVRLELRKLHESGATLREIAAEYEHLTHADVARILAGIMPRSTEKRADLDLPPLGLAPLCPRCGVVHVSRSCPKTHKYRDLWETPTPVLKWQLENRQEIGGENE